MTYRPLAFLLVLCVAPGCGSGSDSGSGGESSARGDSSGVAMASIDSTGSGGGSGGSSSGDERGFFGKVKDMLFSNPRRDSTSVADCSTDQDYSGRSLPFHTMLIDNGNGFNTTNEAFDTSSPNAQTPYVAYASWDPCYLYLGMTGSAVGAGDCDGTDCPVIDLPESPYRYWMVYLDTDPLGNAGSAQPRDLGPTPDRLPMRADYLMEIRLDGVTMQVSDGFAYQGNAQLYDRSSDWRAGLEESWQAQGRDALTVGDNSSSNFIEVSIARSALGDPCAIKAIGWVVDTEADTTFAYWPPLRQPRSGDEASRDTLEMDVYGFQLVEDQRPNASGNINRTDFSLVPDDCMQPTRPRE